jgi:hypothetical protein
MINNYGLLITSRKTLTKAIKMFSAVLGQRFGFNKEKFEKILIQLEDIDENPDTSWVEHQRLRDFFRENCDEYGDLSLHLVLDEEGRVASISLDKYLESTSLNKEIIECYEELLKDEVFPLLAGEEIWINPPLIGIL